MLGWLTTWVLLVGGEMPSEGRAAVRVIVPAGPVVQLHRPSRANVPVLVADDDDDDGDDDPDKEETVRLKKDPTALLLDALAAVAGPREGVVSALRRARLPSSLPLFLCLRHLRN